MNQANQIFFNDLSKWICKNSEAQKFV